MQRGIRVAAAAAAGAPGGWTGPRIPFPPITTIPYNPEYVNRVTMAGRLGGDMQVVSTPHGDIGVFSLAHQAITGASTQWYKVEVYSTLAQQAQQLLGKGMYVNVQGSLRVDAATDANGAQRHSVIIQAEQICVVDDNAPASAMSPPPVQQSRAAAPPQHPVPAAPAAAAAAAAVRPPQPAPPPRAAAAAAPAAASDKWAREAELWEELRANPGAFWDNRTGKRNPKSPDYKNKTTDEALWLTSRTAPAWTAKLHVPAE